jgi:hypothetical protein
MWKLAIRTATQHTDLSFPWYLAIILVCCWSWLFYLLYRVLH